MKTAENQTEKKKRSGKSLSFILWASFTVFSFALIAIFGVVQNMLLYREYREQTVAEVREAGEALTAKVRLSERLDGDELEVYLHDLSKKNSVNAYLLSADGTRSLPETETDFVPVVAEIRTRLKEAGGEDVVFKPNKQEYAFVSSVTVSGESGYVYVTSTSQSMAEISGTLRLRTVITGLFALLLSFVVSGFVSMLIARSVTDVTEKAKLFARGDYDVKFREDYYCTEISELSETLDYAREEISKADKMQKELIANVSHDFKTPLTMIKAYASMIREISGSDPVKRDAHAKIIIEESDRLTALVNDLLDISKLRAGMGALRVGVFNLSEYLFAVTEKFDYLSQTQGYVIEREIEEDLYTRADQEKIGQVLYNLIGNAVNYTGADKKIVVRLYGKGKVSRFEVVDSGNGIAPEEIDGIWERYYRSAETHKRPVKGTGLGLSIVKTVLESHGFRFGVLSQVGKGSCFWAEFPAPEAEDEESPKNL